MVATEIVVEETETMEAEMVMVMEVTNLNAISETKRKEELIPIDQANVIAQSLLMAADLKDTEIIQRALKEATAVEVPEGTREEGLMTEAEADLIHPLHDVHQMFKKLDNDICVNTI